MMLAPQPVFTGQRFGAPSGGQLTSHTVALMRRIVNDAKSSPEIMSAAVSLIYNTPEKSELHEVSAIFEWVRDYVRYVRDVHGLETLTDPRMTLLRRVGDCDDQVMLLCALLEAVGYPTRFVVAGYQSNAFEHIYCQVFAGGEWIDADPTERQPLGYAPPFPQSVMVEPV